MKQLTKKQRREKYNEILNYMLNEKYSPHTISICRKLINDSFGWWNALILFPEFELFHPFGTKEKITFENVNSINMWSIWSFENDEHRIFALQLCIEMTK